MQCKNFSFYSILKPCLEIPIILTATPGAGTKCYESCTDLSRDDYLHLIINTLAEFPGEYCTVGGTKEFKQGN